MEILLQVVILIVGFALLIKGADFFVDGASGIAKRFGIPELVIGLTIVAMGTSAPEAAVSIAGAFKGSADISIGNVVGSNIMNILLILGVTAVIRTLAFEKSTIKIELPFLLIISAMFTVLGLDGVMSRMDGIILWLVFIIYLIYLFKKSKNDKQETGENAAAEKPIWLILIFVVGGMFMIVFGSNIAVDAASKIASAFGMSERLIGLTIVAFGTSLPELVTSVTAARKGNADIAIGNIVGSNIFNYLFVIGTSALIIPINFASQFIRDSIIAIAVAALLWVFALLTKKLDRKSGVVFLICFVAYYAFIMIGQ
ncbi:MAG: calcium/sodium antiporter [Lachnospiraceae bacterium]|nr:calcium/sodium antiporter [Lachnospiraceae bacterium]